MDTRRDPLSISRLQTRWSVAMGFGLAENSDREFSIRYEVDTTGPNATARLIYNLEGADGPSTMSSACRPQHPSTGASAGGLLALCSWMERPADAACRNSTCRLEDGTLAVGTAITSPMTAGTIARKRGPVRKLSASECVLAEPDPSMIRFPRSRPECGGAPMRNCGENRSKLRASIGLCGNALSFCVAGCVAG